MVEQNRGAESTGPQARYFSSLNQGVFEIQRCQACLRHQFYPRVLCQHCGSTELGWVRPSGRGRVYSFSVVSRKPELGGDYNVTLVDLDEGVRLMSRVEDIATEALHIGMEVSACVINQDGQGVVVFQAGGNHENA